MLSFDVSFCNAKGVSKHLRGVKNNVGGITKFLSSLPEDALLCAEHTGVYGDLLLFLCTESNICICFVSGYEIKHSLGLQRGKSDAIDCCRIREYAERFEDKLRPSTFVSVDQYELQELYRTRGQLVESRKRLETLDKGDNCKPLVSCAASRARRAVIEALNEQIKWLDAEILRVIQNSEDFKENYQIITSVVGVGPVTACDLIIKTHNFKKLDTAKKCAAYASLAPYPKESGTMKCNGRTSSMGDKRLKTLLFLCARSAKENNKEIMLYFQKKHDIEKKPFFVVMNNIANKLLHIIYSLINKRELYDRNYIQKGPRFITN